MEIVEKEGERVKPVEVPLALQLTLRRNEDIVEQLKGYNDIILFNYNFEGGNFSGNKKTKQPLMITSGQMNPYNLELVCDLAESYEKLMVFK